MISYHIKTKEICCVSFVFKLHHLFSSHGKAYGIVEDLISEVAHLARFDMQSSSRVHINDLPIQVKFSSIAYSDKYVCIIGGTNEDGQTINVIQVYNFQSKKWMKSLYMSKCYPSCTGVIIDSVLYISNHQNGTIEAFCLPSSSVCPRNSLPPVPFISRCRLLSIGSLVFCIGEGSNTVYALIDVPTVRPAAWQHVFTLPHNFHGVDACAIDNTSRNHGH